MRRTDSPRAAQAQCAFGLPPDPAARLAEHKARRAEARAAARELRRALPPGGVALVTGPSGAGKSTILAELAAALRLRRGVRVVGPSAARGAPGDDQAVIDRVPGALPAALRTLAAAGLADATLLARRGAELSAGEHARLEVALALARARGDGEVWLLLDEFASVLDRVTAATVARGVARAVRRAGGVRLVAATAHDDVRAWLEPDVVVRQGLLERAVVEIVRRPAA